MKTKFQAFVGLTVVVLIAMWLAGCDHYVCTSGATFGSSSCTASGSGLGTGTGGNATAAFVFAIDTTGGATGNVTNGTIDGFTLNTTAGTLAATANYVAPTIPANDTGIGMVVAQGKFLYAAFGSPNNEIFGWAISSSGILTSVNNNTAYAIPSNPPADTSQLITGQQSLITNPAGTLLFVADPGDDEIIAYPIGASGTLGAPVITQIPGFAASNLTTDGKGLYLYATNAFANSNHSPGTTIEEFMIANTGALTSIGSFAAQLWQVVGEPSGKFLIGSAGTQGGADQLSIFQIAQGVGTLSQLNPATTANPSTSIVAQPNANGNLLFSFSLNNGTLNPIEGFTISSTGTLTSAGATSNVAGNGFWGQFDQNGALLFPYTQVSLGNNAFAAEIGAFTVASNGALTEIGSPLTLGTPGYFAVTDAP